MARNKNSSAPSSDAKPAEGLDVASVAPWVLFWGWVALDSALAYRKSQAALDEASAAEPIIPDIEPPPPALALWRSLTGASIWPNSLRAMQKGAKTALIGAPIVAVLAPLLLGKLLRRKEP